MNMSQEMPQKNMRQYRIGSEIHFLTDNVQCDKPDFILMIQITPMWFLRLIKQATMFLGVRVAHK